MTGPKPASPLAAAIRRGVFDAGTPELTAYVDACVRVATGKMLGDWSRVSEDDLALVSDADADRRYREWCKRKQKGGPNSI